jgi:hypothetical protein
VFAVGRHSVPDELPPPPTGVGRLPRWLRQPGPLALLVVAILIVVCGVWAVLDMNRDGGPASIADVPPATYANAETPPADASLTATPGTPSASGGVVGTPVDGGIGPTAGAGASPTKQSSAARPPATTGAPAAPAAAGVTGAYGSVNDWGGGFTGSISISNDSGGASSWTVQLTYPDAVTANHGYWTNSSSQPTLASPAAGGHTWTFTSTTAIPAGGSVSLGFQFDKSGGPVSPVSCTVNGHACG